MEQLRRELYALKDAKCASISRCARNSLTADLVRELQCSNRCFIKLAELDRLTRLLDEPRPVVTFVDLCSGPGGFLEYVLSARWRVYGAAFESAAMPIRQRDYPNLAVFTGDLLDERHFEEFAGQFDSESLKVDLVMADGAIGCEGRENDQEHLNAPLIAAEVAMSKRCLSAGGTLLLKIFDTFTPATKEILRDVYASFASVQVCKPISSNLYNSEKYVVAKGFGEPPSDSLAVFDEVHRQLTVKFARMQYFNIKSSRSFIYSKEETFMYKKFLNVRRRDDIEVAGHLNVFAHHLVRDKAHRTVSVATRRDRDYALGFMFRGDDPFVYFRHANATELKTTAEAAASAATTADTVTATEDAQRQRRVVPLLNVEHLHSMINRIPPRTVLFCAAGGDGRFTYLDVSHLNGRCVKYCTYKYRARLLDDFLSFYKMSNNEEGEADAVMDTAIINSLTASTFSLLTIGTFEMGCFVFL